MLFFLILCMNAYYIIIINIDLFYFDIWHQSDLVLLSDPYCIRFMIIIKYYFDLICAVVIGYLRII